MKRINRRSNSRCKANVAEKCSIWYKKNALLWLTGQNFDFEQGYADVKNSSRAYFKFSQSVLQPQKN